MAVASIVVIAILGALIGSITAYLILEYVPEPYNDVLVAVIIVALIIYSAYAWITY